jgi:site-specific DNA recombinase
MANGNNGNGAPKPVRCAIYTRKSTDEGLNQDFNSLDAQRDAGEAYIRSQAGEGWTLVPEQYDDGGYTGANMERPALRRLLADVKAGKVDCVVVYKVDRLTRSLFDFARIVEVLDKQGVSVVAVTQQFNTTTSLGRRTLNILLWFAQFEREIISERTRDNRSPRAGRGKGPAAIRPFHRIVFSEANVGETGGIVTNYPLAAASYLFLRQSVVLQPVGKIEGLVFRKTLLWTL